MDKDKGEKPKREDTERDRDIDRPPREYFKEDVNKPNRKDVR